MDKNNSYINTLISSGILVFALGYFFAQLQKVRKSKEDLRTKRLTLIEKLNVDAVRINNLFESLRTDAEINGYFAFKNINTINPMVARIQSITTDEIAVFEEGDKLRKEIIDIGDFLSSFLIDVNLLENMAQIQINKDQESTDKFNQDLKRLRSNVLRYGIQITPFLDVVNPSEDNTNKHYNATLSSISEIRAARQKTIDEATKLIENLKDRRIFYSIKCLDSQNRLRRFSDLLEKAEAKYTKRNWFLKLLNRVAL